MNGLLARLFGAEPRTAGSRFLVTNPAQVASLLQKAMRARARLALRVATSPEPRSSLILAVDPTRRRLALDEPWPQRPGPSPGERLAITTRVDGVELAFELQLEQCLQRRDGQVLQCHLPHSLVYRQQRRSFRIRVPEDSRMSRCVIAPADQPPRRARIVDLSSHGFGAVLLSRADLTIGDTLDCELSVDEHLLITPTELRSLVQVIDRDRVGLLFGPLTVADQRLIDGSIARLQREGLARLPAQATAEYPSPASGATARR